MRESFAAYEAVAAQSLRWPHVVDVSLGLFDLQVIRCKFAERAFFFLLCCSLQILLPGRLLTVRGSTKVSFIDTIAHFVVYNARGTQPELIDRVCTVSHFLGIVSKNFLENFLQTPRYNFSHLVDRPCKKEGDFVLNTVILNK